MLNIDRQELFKQIHYDPLTGVFTRISKPKGSRAVLGVIKGYAKEEGHLRVSIFSQEVYLARLAWFYVHGVWGDVVDHKNGDPTDNRLDNLRNTSKLGNVQNQVRAHHHNKVGLLGVCFSKAKNKYRANISHQGVMKHLGYFASAEEAHEAYLAAKRTLHTTCTI